MTEKRLVAKKPVAKKKPKPLTEEEYNYSLEQEVINILKLRGLYSDIEEFAKRYYRSCSPNMRKNYPKFEYFKEFLEYQTQEHIKNLEKIVRQKYSKGLP